MTNLFKDALNLYQSGNKSKAYKLLKKENAEDLLSLKLMMLLESDLNNHLKAIDIGKVILSKTEDKTHLREVLYLIAKSCIKLNNVKDSQSYLEQSVELDPSIQNAGAMYDLLNLYISTNQILKVEELGLKLLKFRQYQLPTKVILLESAAQTENKHLLTERLKEISPYIEQLNLELFSKVISYLIDTESFDICEKSLDNFQLRHKIDVFIKRAELQFKQKKFHDVIKTLSKPNIAKDAKNKNYYYLLANAYDAIGDYQKAIEYYEKAAKLAKRLVGNSHKTDIIPSFNNIIPNIKIFDEKKTNKELVFIFGFPRSGTTLLDNILDTQNALVLSEKNILQTVIAEYENLGYRFPNDLPKLKGKDTELLREIYFNEIKKQGYNLESNEIIIEKNPHYSELLPLIKILFPCSKLILMIRNPLDTCISCYQQDFELSGKNIFLSKLGDIVSRYIAVFQLLERYEKELGIECEIVKYEDLVSNLDEKMASICNYIGLELQNNYTDFYKLSSTKYISSASRGQTDKKIHTNSIDKWENYQELLKPYKEKLNHFIVKYGY